MRAIVKSLLPTQTVKLFSFVEQLPPLFHPSTLGGDPVVGKLIFESECMEYHHYNGHGMSSFRSAPLNGRQDWYLLEQLKKFTEGILYRIWRITVGFEGLL